MTWSEFTWPAWVPVDLRERVMRCWKPDSNYTKIGGKTEAAGWLQNTRNNHAPALGDRVVAWLVFKREQVRGRYVHTQNNLGYVVTDDGVPVFVCSDGAKPDTLVEWMP